MDKKNWLIIGIVVLIAFGIYYNQDGMLSPGDNGPVSWFYCSDTGYKEVTGCRPAGSIKESSTFNCDDNDAKNKAIENFLKSLGVDTSGMCEEGIWGCSDGTCKPTGLKRNPQFAGNLELIKNGDICKYKLRCPEWFPDSPTQKTLELKAVCSCMSKKVVAQR